jgi:hypothetical protein
MMLVMLLWVYIHTGQAWKICLTTVGIEPTTFRNTSPTILLDYTDIEGTRLSSEISHTRTDLTRCGSTIACKNNETFNIFCQFKVRRATPPPPPPHDQCWKKWVEFSPFRVIQTTLHWGWVGHLCGCLNNFCSWL